MQAACFSGRGAAPPGLTPTSPIRGFAPRPVRARTLLAHAEGDRQRRTTTVLGDIVETDAGSLPEPDAADFFEGDRWEWLGSVQSLVLPVLVALAVVTGVFAAKTYDTGANAVLVPAQSEDQPAMIGPAPQD